MADQYQRGSDEDWVKAENDELRHIIEKRDSQIARLRIINAVLLAAVAWVAYMYSQKGSVSDLIPIAKLLQRFL